MKKIVKLIIRLLSVIFIVLVIVLGFYSPNIVMTYTDKKSDGVVIKEFPDIYLDIKEELSYEEKFLLANSSNCIIFDAGKYVSTEEEVKARAIDLIEEMVFELSGEHYDIEVNVESICPMGYMKFENMKSVFWNVEISVDDNFLSFVFDDESLELLSFSFFSNYEVYDAKESYHMAVFFCRQLNSQFIKISGLDEYNGSDNNYNIEFYINYGEGYYAVIMGYPDSFMISQIDGVKSEDTAIGNDDFSFEQEDDDMISEVEEPEEQIDDK